MQPWKQWRAILIACIVGAAPAACGPAVRKVADYRDQYEQRREANRVAREKAKTTPVQLPQSDQSTSTPESSQP